MRASRGAVIITALVALVASSFLAADVSASPSTTGERVKPPPTERRAHARLVRLIEAADVGVQRPAGVAFNQLTGDLLVADASGSALHLVAPNASLRGVVPLARPLINPATLAFDAQAGRLLAAEGNQHLLVAPWQEGRPPQGTPGPQLVDVGAAGLERIDGIAVGSDGTVYILDGPARRVVALAPRAGGTLDVGQAQREGRISEISLAHLSTNALLGLAFHPASGSLFSVDGTRGLLFELDPAGGVRSVRDLGELGLRSPRGIAIGSSGDATDDPTAMSLYVADAGTTEGTDSSDAGVAEIELVSALTITSSSSSLCLVSTIDTATWSPASPDPSGLAYLAPDEDLIVVVDGEVDETTGAGFHDVNGWSARRTGAPGRGDAFDSDDTFNTTNDSPLNKEAVGVAYDPVRNELYVSRDGGNGRIWVYSAGPDRLIGSQDDVVDRTFWVDEQQIPIIQDAEGLGFDAANNRLLVADGVGREIWIFAAGSNGRVDGSPAAGGDDVITSFDTSAHQPDPEGVAVDPDTGRYWIVSNDKSAPISEVTPTGALVQTISTSPLSPRSFGGLEIAAASNGSGARHFYIAERGVDNGDDASENDGKIYEAVPGDCAPAPPPSTDNLLSNPGFEADADGNGIPDGWGTRSSFTRSTAIPPHGGTYSGRHELANDGGYTIYQQVSASAGTHAVGGWVNIPATSDRFTFKVKVQWRGASGAIRTDVVVTYKGSTAGWVAFSKSLTAPSGTTTARLQMTVSSLNASIYVDDFELRPS